MTAGENDRLSNEGGDFKCVKLERKRSIKAQYMRGKVDFVFLL